MTTAATDIDSSSSRPRALRGGDFLWAAKRREKGMSLRDLEAKTGIYRGFLSRMENGVMIPTSEEFEKVMAALG